MSSVLEQKIYQDLNNFEKDVIISVGDFTMVSPERIVNIVNSVEYIIKNNIAGDFAECGVWKGGCVMAVIKALVKLDETDRHIWLYDTFTGMSEPTKKDESLEGEFASERYEKNLQEGTGWCEAGLEEVKNRILSSGYPENKIHFVKGMVEDTIPQYIPDSIAFLRLDTDWYTSTMHELKHLYPLVVKDGVLAIDDYGHWKGCKKAVDEYFVDERIFLQRIDYTGRSMIKLS